MKVYTVHMRRHGLDLDRDLVLVAEGFSWGAFFLSLFWALWNRLWWVALALVVLSVALDGLIWLIGADPATATLMGFALAALTGMLANDLRRWSLGLQGFADCGVVVGQNADAALARFLDASPDLAREAL